MAKGKITSNDFLALLDEDEQSFQPVAFAPQKTEPKLEPTKKSIQSWMVILMSPQLKSK